mmetsp:Transcript_10750/g.12609  ORF Transcript_10750/g.12609 Transcript_10750/m.12609 type:complete len:306 (-) Transcript_10750:2125-3042(-)
MSCATTSSLSRCAHDCVSSGLGTSKVRRHSTSATPCQTKSFLLRKKLSHSCVGYPCISYQRKQQWQQNRRTTFRICAQDTTDSSTTTAPPPPSDVTEFVDEEAMLAASDFPIPPEELIAKAKEWVRLQSQGVYDEDALSSDYVMIGPVAGPLNGKQHIKSVGSFNFKEAIPDMTGQLHHFRVDPFEPSRVWFTRRTKGTHTGTLMIGGKLPIKPTGKSVESPPQAMSIRFDPDGKINQYTVGYSMDKNLGNTGGLGGIFGTLYALGVGLPFPEGQPWKPSWQFKLFQWITSKGGSEADLQAQDDK